MQRFLEPNIKLITRNFSGQNKSACTCKLSTPSIHPALDTCLICGPIFKSVCKRNCQPQSVFSEFNCARSISDKHKFYILQKMCTIQFDCPSNLFMTGNQHLFSQVADSDS